MMNLADLLNILLDSNISEKTCFLCLKSSQRVTNVNDHFEIYFENKGKFCISLKDIMRRLFPKHDLLLNHACDFCSNIVTEMFMILWRNKVIKSLLHSLITEINDSLDQSSLQNSIKINVNLPPSNTLKTKQTNINIKFNCQTAEDNTEKEICKKCDMKFENSSILQEHIKLLHNKSNQSTICDICGKICRNPRMLKAHLHCHSVKQCPHCLKTLKTHSHYLIHVRNHNKNSKKNSQTTFYNCYNCDYRSLSKASLKAHINKVHLNIRPHSCSVCSKSFYKKSNLLEHELIHSLKEGHICDICGGNFASNKCLVVHMRVHKKEKPYVCNICSKSFVTSGRRLEHIRRSHMDKNFKCDLCDKKFSLLKDLKRHEKVHYQPMQNLKQSEIGETSFS